jgi:pyruvate/2-oxoglutarate dehydrogenase complex dihydrolipoamide acyltransferase (E2) component
LIRDRGVNAQISKKTLSMTDFQKGMQKAMTESLSIPHFYYKDEIDMTSMVYYFKRK